MKVDIMRAHQTDVQATENSFTIQGKREALLDKEKVQTHRNAGLSESSQLYFTYTLPVAIDSKRIAVLMDRRSGLLAGSAAGDLYGMLTIGRCVQLVMSKCET